MKLAGGGSTSDVYTAKFLDTPDKVVIKVIKESLIKIPLSVQEFDDEYAILCQINHRNIIRVLGSGFVPRRFIVLEWLSGGSLEHTQSSMRKRDESQFEFQDVIRMAKEIVSAMDYLHRNADPMIKIIHRDLKPANMGFTKDGTLKIFDFGLSCCVQHSDILDEEYDMSGCTGTIRYMAPEVAKHLPYSEKVDVYSFSIVMWQLASGEIFKKDCSRSEIIRDVVKGGERPKIDNSWPSAFSALLQSCWDANPRSRPSFASIHQTLQALSGSRVEVPNFQVFEKKVPKKALFPQSLWSVVARSLCSCLSRTKIIAVSENGTAMSLI